MTSGEKEMRLVRIHVVQCMDCDAWAAGYDRDGLADCLGCEHTGPTFDCIVEAEVPRSFPVVRGEVCDGGE